MSDGDIAGDWDGAVRKATKILGPTAKIPKLPSTIHKALQDTIKEYQNYKKVRGELESIILKAQGDFSAVKNATVQFSDKVDDDDFGLDSKGKEDAKKIDQAHKILGEVLSDFTSVVDQRIKNLRELNKHLDDLAKYKGPS